MRAATDAPCPGASVAARAMGIFPIPARWAAIPNRKNLARMGWQKKKLPERIAGALAEASDKSEFVLFPLPPPSARRGA